MLKLLYFGDPHIRGTNPRNRLDDYKEALKTKFLEIFELAEKHQVAAILQPGDTFDRPEVSTSVLLEFVGVLEKSPVPIYTTAGNHDIYGYNLSTYNRTSLRLLELLVDQFIVCNTPEDGFYMDDLEGKTRVQVTFSPYSSKIDHEGYGYSPEGSFANTTNAYKIHVAHGMLLDHEPPFDRYTYIGDVETTADLVLCGHDHTGFGIHRRADGKVFMNCGSLTRLSATLTEMERPIQVALITVDGMKCDIELIPLQCAKPGAEILDRSRIEAEQKRAYAMENFAALIQTKTGDHMLLDIDQILESIASVENINPEVVQIAREKIEEQKQFVGA